LRFVNKLYAKFPLEPAKMFIFKTKNDFKK